MAVPLARSPKTSGFIGRARRILGPILNRTFLPVVFAFYALGVLCYLLVWVVDPFDLRTSGAIVKLGDQAYADDVIPHLFSIAAKDGTDFVLVGGSTSTGYTVPMLREAFPDASKPVNLSYAGQTANGVAIALRQLEASKTLKHVIISLDWTFASDRVSDGGAPLRQFYSKRWKNPAPEFDLDAILLASRVLIAGGMNLPAKQRLHPERADFMTTSLPVTATPAYVAKFAAAADVSRAWITRAPTVECAAIPFLTTVILPFAQRMADRGVPVDLLAPPYSLALYSDWSVNMPDGRIFSGKGATFARLLALRRCAVEMAAKTDNLKVHIFDTDKTITADLSRYYDTGHLNDPKAYQDILRRVASGSSVVTPKTWANFESKFRTDVETFRPKGAATN